MGTAMAPAPRQIAAGTVVIEAEVHFPSVAVAVNHLDLVETKRHVLRPEQCYRLDLCITPRLPSRMQFDSWAPTRFERPGRLFIVPPGQTLGIENALGRESVVVCHLAADAMQRWLAAEIAPDREVLDITLDVPSAAIEQLMLRLTEEIRHPGFASGIMVEACAMQIAVELQRHYLRAPAGEGSGGLAPWRLRRIDERLASLDQPPSLSELASLCGLSVRQLSRGFQASRGLSIGQHVARQRIDKARQYLVTCRSVKEVAYQLGFHSSAAFCSAFRKATGVTPAVYRQLVTVSTDNTAECGVMFAIRRPEPDAGRHCGQSQPRSTIFRSSTQSVSGTQGQP